jgi:hypothetical protein
VSIWIEKVAAVFFDIVGLALWLLIGISVVRSIDK